jgi:hypothetical protein
MPNFFEGVPAPLRMVFATFAGEGPAALLLDFSAPMADGSITTDRARAIATKVLLVFMIHQSFYVGN